MGTDVSPQPNIKTTDPRPGQCAHIGKRSRSSGGLGVVLGLSLVALACTSTPSPTHTSARGPNPLTQAIIAQDQMRVDTLTDEVMAGRAVLDAQMLTDERQTPWAVVKATTPDGRLWQLGVGSVSEYGLCLLQLKHQTSSEAILAIVAPSERQACAVDTSPGQMGCEVCNSALRPVSTDIRKALVTYWLSRGVR